MNLQIDIRQPVDYVARLVYYPCVPPVCWIISRYWDICQYIRGTFIIHLITQFSCKIRFFHCGPRFCGLSGWQSANFFGAVKRGASASEPYTKEHRQTARLKVKSATLKRPNAFFLEILIVFPPRIFPTVQVEFFCPERASESVYCIMAPMSRPVTNSNFPRWK